MTGKANNLPPRPTGCIVLYIQHSHTQKTLHKLHIDWSADYCLAVNVWACVCTACLQSRRNQKTWNSMLTNFGRSDKTRKRKKKCSVLLKIENEGLHVKFEVSFLSPALGKSRPVGLLICRLSCLVMLTSTDTQTHTHTHILLHNIVLEQQHWMAELVCFSPGSLFKGALQQFNIALTNNTGRLMGDERLREIRKRMVEFAAPEAETS